MEKIIKIFFILAILTMMLCVFCNSIYGAEFDAESYEPASTTTANDANKLKEIGNTIVGVIRTIGSIASVGVLIVVGVKYMAGSVEEKAQYKNSMLPYIIGAALVFGITNLLGIIIDIAGLFK